MTLQPSASAADLPPRTPSKKHDEESMSSGKREDSSPILKKAGAALQLRSAYILDLGLGLFLFAL
jgi:CCR4-NOT transcription complex subunit 3